MTTISDLSHPSLLIPRAWNLCSRLCTGLERAEEGKGNERTARGLAFFFPALH
jgi:hypothetical protein